MHTCDWCGKPYTDTAADDCVNSEHWATDTTLGLREAGCGCCYVVDAVALESLRSTLTTPVGGGA